MDPKDHEEVVAENQKLEQSLADSEKAKGLLESSKAELIRTKAAVEKQRDDANAMKSKIATQVCTRVPFSLFEILRGNLIIITKYGYYGVSDIFSIY